jgi:propanediol utilization protein
MMLQVYAQKLALVISRTLRSSLTQSVLFALRVDIRSTTHIDTDKTNAYLIVREIILSILIS